MFDIAKYIQASIETKQKILQNQDLQDLIKR